MKVNTTNDKPVKVTIPVPEEFRKQIKIHAIQNSESLKDYVIDAVKKKMSDEDDNYWGEMALAGDKEENYVSAEESEALIDEILKCEE